MELWHVQETVKGIAIFASLYIVWVVLNILAGG